MNNISPININKIPLKDLKTHFSRINFCGTNKEKYENPNILKAVEFGFDLYNNPASAFKYIVKKSMPDVNVIFVGSKNIAADADLSYKHNKNFEPYNYRLHSTCRPKTILKGSKILYSLAFAHEYTHYLQHKSKSYVNFIKNLSGGNWEYLCSLSPIGCGIFDELDEEKFYFSNKIFGPLDVIMEHIYSISLPRKKSFTNADILASKNMKTKEEFKKYILNKYDRIFDRTIEIILTEPDSADKKIFDFVQNIAKSDDDLIKFKNNLRKFCANKARQEKEAYKTESLLAKKILNTDKRLNIDFYTIYFSMLEEALS